LQVRPSVLVTDGLINANPVLLVQRRTQ
jgi:hypothetical protein